MLDKYLIENYDKLKDIAHNIAGVKEKDDLFSFVIEELYKCDQIRLREIIEERLEWVEEKLKDLYWFDAECFRIYYRENFTFTEMAKATKISRGTLYKAIKNVKNYLINER